MNEYSMRQRLRKIGYQFDPNELSVFKATVFVIIAEELDRLEKDKLDGNKGEHGK